MEDQNKQHKVEKNDSGSKSNNGWLWIVGVLVLVGIAGVWALTGGVQVPADDMDSTATTTEDQTTMTDDGATTTEPELGEDSVEDIQQQLEGINVEDIEGELQNIDQDLQELESGSGQ